MANKRNCIICGKVYDYCPTCRTKKPAWMALFDSETCHEIYDIISDYNFKRIDKTEAKSRLNTIKIKSSKGYNNAIKTVLDEIFSAPVVKETKSTVTEDKETKKK